MNVIYLKGEKYYSCFIRDITEQKRAQQELVNAKKTAEQARLAERQFLANMSHEIRTPMNAVIGMTYLLGKTNLNKYQKDYLDALNFSANNLMGILNNILDISKVEAGEIEFEERSFNLTKLLQSIHQTFQFKLKSKNIPIHLNIDPNIQNQIIGDPTRLSQILTNLLSNSSKFTDQGHIKLGAKLLEATHTHYLIQFEIADTGIGISEENLNTIFNNFKQAGKDIMRKFGGTGLGLPIVKELTTLQGGTLNIDSKLNKGTIFNITLSFKNTGVKAIDVKEDTINSKEENELLRKGHFLFVEDNTMNQKLIMAILDTWDCSYEIASNGLEALALTSGNLFDIIFMDIHMPGMDGLEASLKIRQNQQNKNYKTPIIALTAAALLEEKKRAMQVGMNDFLTKPFAPEQIRLVMLKYLSQNEKLTNRISNQQIFDLNSLKRMSLSNPLFFTEMIEIYLRDVPIALTEMETQFMHKNWQEIGDVAHKVKSNFMIVGMKKAVEMALSLEKEIREQKAKPATIQHCISELRKLAEQTFPIFQEELENYKSTVMAVQ